MNKGCIYFRVRYYFIFIIIWGGKLTSCGGIFWIFLRLFLLFFEMSFEIIFSLRVLVYKCDIRKRKHLQTKQHPMWRWRLNSLEFFKLIIFHCIIEKKFVKTGYFKLLLFYITHQTLSLYSRKLEIRLLRNIYQYLL